MATRSTIGIQNPDNSIDVIYCHWDGYYEGVGRILKTHYNSEEKAIELISNGNVSSLADDLDKTVFYGRDHKDTGQEFKKVNSKSEYKILHQEFNYLWINDKWLCSLYDEYNFKEFKGDGND